MDSQWIESANNWLAIEIILEMIGGICVFLDLFSFWFADRQYSITGAGSLELNWTELNPNILKYEQPYVIRWKPICDDDLGWS